MLFLFSFLSCASSKSTVLSSSVQEPSDDTALHEVEEDVEQRIMVHPAVVQEPQEYIDHCEEVRNIQPRFHTLIKRWNAQDDLHPWKPGGLVAVGSSSIRRWEEMAQIYSRYHVIQRGFGGSYLSEAAYFSTELITRHQPAGVVVFAGTNDLKAKVPVTVVGNRLRCLVQRLRSHSPDLPIFFIAVNPTPSRWKQWPAAEVLHVYAKELDRDDRHFYYVDIATPFLATGRPPDRSLFVHDALHLTPKGYAIWQNVLTPLLDEALPRAPKPTIEHERGTRWLIDFGSHDGRYGRHSKKADRKGQYWNNWHPIKSGRMIFPGERLAKLQTDRGISTDLELVITGGFSNRGRQHGGLLRPQTKHLGALAIRSATEDYFYALPHDRTGGIQLRGLSPKKNYTIRIFASRRAKDVRITRYTLIGSEIQSKTLQTSGRGAGSKGQNDRKTAKFLRVKPDDYGHLYIDVAIAQGSEAYIGLMEIIAE